MFIMLSAFFKGTELAPRNVECFSKFLYDGFESRCCNVYSLHIVSLIGLDRNLTLNSLFVS